MYRVILPNYLLRMSALPPKADIELSLGRRGANDPKQTLGFFGMRYTFVTFQKRTILGQSEIRLHPVS